VTCERQRTLSGKRSTSLMPDLCRKVDVISLRVKTG
jgi:hypothetical protein